MVFFFFILQIWGLGHTSAQMNANHWPPELIFHGRKSVYRVRKGLRLGTWSNKLRWMDTAAVFKVDRVIRNQQPKY